MSVTELWEQLGMSEEAGVSIKQVAQQARNENGQTFFEIFSHWRRRGMHCQLGQMERAVQTVWWSWKKRCQNMRQEVDFLCEKTRHIQRDGGRQNQDAEQSNGQVL